MASSEDNNTILDYERPTPSSEPRRLWVDEAVAAYALGTAAASILVFGSGAVRFARPGSGLYGPADQYASEVNWYASVLIGFGLCVVGSACFHAGLLLWRRGRYRRRHSWFTGFLLGLLYVVFFGCIVWIAEQVAGANSGGPQRPELVAHLMAGVICPFLAARLMYSTSTGT